MMNFIDGAWVRPEGRESLEVLNPATQEILGTVRLSGKAEGDQAALAALAAVGA